MDGEYKKLAEATPRTMPDSQLDMIWENDFIDIALSYCFRSLIVSK